jgi:hypothetical protein
MSCETQVKKIERAGSLQKAQERMENDEKMKAQLEAAHHSVPALRSHLIPQVRAIWATSLLQNLLYLIIISYHCNSLFDTRLKYQTKLNRQKKAEIGCEKPKLATVGVK